MQWRCYIALLLLLGCLVLGRLESRGSQVPFLSHELGQIENQLGTDVAK